MTMLPIAHARPRSSPSATHHLAGRAVWLVAFTIGCVVLFVALYTFAVQTAWGQRAGNAALAGRLDALPSFANSAIDLLLATISNGSLAVMTAVLAAIGLARGGLRLAAVTGGVIFVANVATQLLKRVVLDRPELSNAGDQAGAVNSLPSGHATVAMSIAVAVALVSPARFRWLLMVPATSYALAVGAATVIGGWHRPSDVMAAYLVAIGTAAFGGAVLLALRRPGSGPATWHPRLAESRLPAWLALLAIAAAVLAVALIALVSAVIGLRWDQLGGAEFNVAFFAGITACTSAGVFLMAGLLALFSGVDFGGIDD